MSKPSFRRTFHAETQEKEPRSRSRGVLVRTIRRAAFVRRRERPTSCGGQDDGDADRTRHHRNRRKPHLRQHLWHLSTEGGPNRVEPPLPRNRQSRRLAWPPTRPREAVSDRHD